MNRNSNLSPLPWYESLEEQGFRKHWAYGKVWPLIAHRDYLLPFQLVMPNGVNPDMSQFNIYMHKYGTDTYFEVTEMMQAAGLRIDDARTLEGYVNLIFPANFALDWTIQGMDFNRDFSEDFGGPNRTSIGRYYMRITTTVDGVTKEWYSEVMTFVYDLQGYLKLEWYSLDDLVYDGGAIIYTSPVNYTNYLWIPADVAMPDYTFEEEGEERDGFFFPTKQTSEKTYRFAFLATEEVCDAMRLVGLSDVVIVIDPLGRRYVCDKFTMTPEWQQQGYLASVNCEFQTDTVVIRRAAAYTPAQTAKAIAEGEGVRPNTSLANSYYVLASGAEFVFHVFPRCVSVTLSDESFVTVSRISSTELQVNVDANTGSSTRPVIIEISTGSAVIAVRLDQDGAE